MSRSRDIAAGSTRVDYIYTATANQTTFTGSDSNSNTLSYTAGLVEVFLNGTRLSAADFTATNGTSVVLASGADVNDIINIVAYGVFSVADRIEQRTEFDYTATSGQTTFTGADNDGETLSYTVGKIDVYLNGSHLNVTDDYVASNGTSIVLQSGATTGDILHIVNHGTTSLIGNFVDGETLDVNGNEIILDADGDTSIHADTDDQIDFKTGGTDRIAINSTALEVKGNSDSGILQLNCEQNSHGVKIKGPPHSAGQDYTLTLPSSITNDYYLKTDGSGNLSFAEVPTETKPTVADVSQTIAPDSATTINITGTNFVTVPIVEFIKTDGSITRPNSVSFTNATTLSVNITLTSGQYHVRVENPDGNAGRSTNNILTASTAPTFSTSAGSLGSVAAGASVSIDVDGSSDSTVAFSETTSVLTSNSDTPASTMNLSLNSSTGVISGTAPSPTSETTYNFTLRLTDAESQTVDRAFSITISVGMNNSGQFN